MFGLNSLGSRLCQMLKRSEKIFAARWRKTFGKKKLLSPPVRINIWKYTALFAYHTAYHKNMIVCFLDFLKSPSSCLFNSVPLSRLRRSLGRFATKKQRPLRSLTYTTLNLRKVYVFPLGHVSCQWIFHARVTVLHLKRLSASKKTTLDSRVKIVISCFVATSRKFSVIVSIATSSCHKWITFFQSGGWGYKTCCVPRFSYH